jgi:hypothetical protein
LYLVLNVCPLFQQWKLRYGKYVFRRGLCWNIARNVKWTNLAVELVNIVPYILQQETRSSYRIWKWFDEHSINCWACVYSSGKHLLFLYTLTNFDAISRIAAILSCTNVLKIWQGSVILFTRYDTGNVYSVYPAACGIRLPGRRVRRIGGNPCTLFLAQAFHFPSTIFADSLTITCKL